MQRSMVVTFNKESEVVEKNLTFLATSGLPPFHRVIWNCLGEL